MATYKQIQAEIKKRYGYSAVTGWIAHVKEHHGLTKRKAHNRINNTKRVNPCPPEKWADIEAVLQSFGMITQSRSGVFSSNIQVVGTNNTISSEINLIPAKHSPWYWLMQQSILHDKSSKEPDGWHWLVFLYYLIGFDIGKIQRNLPESHPLKSASLQGGAHKTAYMPIITEFIQRAGIPQGTQKNVNLIDFSKLIFSETPDFSNFIFPINVNFGSTIFSKQAIFTNAVFLNIANFSNTKFSEEAGFENALFSVMGNFYMAVFSENAEFSGVIFSQAAGFRGTTFYELADFSNSKFKKHTIFADAKFKKYAPHFYNAEISADTIWERRIEFWPQLKEYKNKITQDEMDEILRMNQNAYENLAYQMKVLEKYHDEHFFFRQEMRCRKKLEPPLIKPFYWLYEFVADYGYGVERAFIAWFLHIVLGAVVLMLFTNYYWAYNPTEFQKILNCVTPVSFANANPYAFFSFDGGKLAGCYTKLGYLLPRAFGIIKIIQIVIGVSLLFIVLLTLRIRFRLK